MDGVRVIRQQVDSQRQKDRDTEGQKRRGSKRIMTQFKITYSFSFYGWFIFIYSFSLYFEQITWTFCFNASEKHEVMALDVSCMAEVEGIVKMIWLGKKFQNPQLMRYIASASEEELQRLKTQIGQKLFPKSGCITHLDPLHDCPPEAAQYLFAFQPTRSTRRWIPVRHDEPASNILLGLGRIIQNVTSAAVKSFCLDSDGLICATLNNAVYLKETMASDKEFLIVVKIPRNNSAVISLQNEYRALLALQSTGRVVKLFSNSSEKSGIDFIFTYYHPTSLEWSAHIWHSLEEILLLSTELLNAIAAIHKKRWLVISLNPDSILFNTHRKHPSDPFLPLLLTGLENAVQFNELSASVPSEYMQNPRFDGFRAPEFTKKQPPSEKTDMFSAGLIILAALLRRLSPFNNDEENFRILQGGLPVDEILACFNEAVHDEDQRLDCSHGLLSLLQDILSLDPDTRPTVNQALKKLKQLSKSKHIHLTSGKVTQSIPGGLDIHTGEFLWPVDVNIERLEDQDNPDRLSDYFSVISPLPAPPKTFLAAYGGRPVSKRELYWLEHLGLDTHALNEGSYHGLARDGRRLCNGIYNQNWYFTKREVGSFIDDAYETMTGVNTKYKYLECSHQPEGPSAMLTSRRILIQSTRQLKANEELFVSYGKTYRAKKLKNLPKVQDIQSKAPPPNKGRPT